ncbi:hypothetical protein BJ322DRAFT_465771 [Thelephora terrestris]|uniref:Ion transport domain-containing protein n=1 Tax=Thelephora terrestris TaxID=56493 RepID=A0A9P6H4K4_9AGAM|nr:hypothetical protein BJ322DRAFT_661286 [Thelephora terrestris]KAF9778972.1 hypothetical protein BJ322DRAFT_465771 [Thelephora terrestris]
MDTEEQIGLLATTTEDLETVKVFPLIPHILKDANESIDAALSWDQLTASDINFAIIRPLVYKYARLKNPATVYACLVVRSHFLSLAGEDMACTGIMLARADMCEILAMKLLNRFSSRKIELTCALMTSWDPLAGAPEYVYEGLKSVLGRDRSEVNDPQCALEMAIATKAKQFVAAPLAQTVVNDVYSGKIVFSNLATSRSVLADNYKRQAIAVYDHRTAPFLDHYRLRVPKYGAILEFLNFAALLIVFVLCLSNAETSHMTAYEILFIVFAASFALAEYTASREHGWDIYLANMWNVFDSSFILIFFLYIVLRVKGLATGDESSSGLGFDILACGACILFPRLAFFAVKNKVVVLVLRAMIAQFVFFIGIAAICFSGLLFTLHTLSADAPKPWSWTSIAWFMVQVWFGNTSMSFTQASSFHPIFGPFLMTAFAALSNTMLLTILTSILSNTYARTDANASREFLFQFAMTTIEGSKSDALFSYQLPFNLLAFLVLWPLSYVLSPRKLHSANVFMIKLTSFPTLVVIGLCERGFSAEQPTRGNRDTTSSFYNSIRNMPLLETIMGTGSNDLYDAIFSVDAPPEEGLFGDFEEDERPALRSIASSTRLRSMSRGRTPGPGPVPKMNVQSPPTSPRSPTTTGTPDLSPRVKPMSITTSNLLEPGQSGEQTYGKLSPLARLFSGGNPIRDRTTSMGAGASLKKVETLLEDIKQLPVNKFTEEMRELQDRQARIENLLLTLTRGMRHDGIPSRHGSQ